MPKDFSAHFVISEETNDRLTAGASLLKCTRSVFTDAILRVVLGLNPNGPVSAYLSALGLKPVDLSSVEQDATAHKRQRGRQPKNAGAEERVSFVQHGAHAIAVNRAEPNSIKITHKHGKK